MGAMRKHVSMLGNSTCQGSVGDLYVLREDSLTWQGKRRWGGVDALSLITMTHSHRNGMCYLPQVP